MKKAAKIMALIATGIVVGFIAGSLNSFRAIARFACDSVLEMAVDAKQLEQGDAGAVLERKKTALPRQVQQLDSVFAKYIPDQQVSKTLILVREFYETSGVEPPSSIKAILRDATLQR